MEYSGASTTLDSKMPVADILQADAIVCEKYPGRPQLSVLYHEERPEESDPLRCWYGLDEEGKVVYYDQHTGLMLPSVETFATTDVAFRMVNRAHPAHQLGRRMDTYDTVPLVAHSAEQAVLGQFRSGDHEETVLVLRDPETADASNPKAGIRSFVMSGALSLEVMLRMIHITFPEFDPLFDEAPISLLATVGLGDPLEEQEAIDPRGLEENPLDIMSAEKPEGPVILEEAAAFSSRPNQPGRIRKALGRVATGINKKLRRAPQLPELLSKS